MASKSVTAKMAKGGSAVGTMAKQSAPVAKQSKSGPKAPIKRNVAKKGR